MSDTPTLSETVITLLPLIIEVFVTIVLMDFLLRFVLFIDFTKGRK